MISEHHVKAQNHLAFEASSVQPPIQSVLNVEVPTGYDCADNSYSFQGADNVHRVRRVEHLISKTIFTNEMFLVSCYSFLLMVIAPYVLLL